FFFSSRRRHTRFSRDWSSDVCSSDLGEEKVYEPGNDKLLVNYKGWNICPLICYDLRFPVYSRIVDEAYDLLIYVASWPDQRIYRSEERRVGKECRSGWWRDM